MRCHRVSTFILYFPRPADSMGHHFCLSKYQNLKWLYNPHRAQQKLNFLKDNCPEILMVNKHFRFLNVDFP